MSILLVTYDLKAPGRNYQPVHDYFKQFNRCKDLESVYLIETSKTATNVRDEMTPLVDANDKVFVVKITRSWASRNFGCGNWLNDPARKWD